MRPPASRVLLALAFASLSGCRCNVSLQTVAPARLVASPAALRLGPVFVGDSALGSVTVSNDGEATAEEPVSVEGPFHPDVTTVRLVRGESTSVVIRHSPTAPGVSRGALRLGSLEVPLEAEALELPACRAASVCVAARFEASRAECVESSKPDGEACETSCLIGACTSGTCVGRLKTCDDGDPCTVDACDEQAGCSRSPRRCPEPGVCQLSYCRAPQGCVVETAPDGTLCGPDVCTEPQVDVCLSGVCVKRTRPETGRCSNRWVPVTIPARSGHAMVWDEARRRVVLFGGWAMRELSDTWEWNGTRWVERTPNESPPARSGAPLAWDALRQRVVLFGGQGRASDRLSDTWEWDGATWTRRAPTLAPSARVGHAMTWDAVRQRIVLFGGADGVSRLADTWEWDGLTWTQLRPTTSPPPRAFHRMAQDAARRRVVLFGGGLAGDPPLTDTWEWDGSTWTQHTPTTVPPALVQRTMAWDPQRQRVLLLGGERPSGALADAFPTDVWEWDGRTWSAQAGPAPPGRADAAMAWDGSRLVLFGGRWRVPFLGERLRSDTWAWNGASWAPRTPPEPPTRTLHALAWDAARGRVVLFGGHDSFSDTWEWDGSEWAERSPADSPPARCCHALAWDAVRRRVLLFGGTSSRIPTDPQTWAWNGSTWTELQVGSPPHRFDHAMASDLARQRIVLFGGREAVSQGRRLSDTWEWDGTSWTERSAITSPSPRERHSMAWDVDRRRVVLFGGDDGAATLADTWEWDGTTWTRPSPTASPPPSAGHTMAWDGLRRRVVALLRSGETWEWDGTTWAQRQPVTSPPAVVGSNALVWDEARQRLVVFNGSETWQFLP